MSELVRQTLRAEYALAVAPMLRALDRRAALLVIALLATVGASVRREGRPS